MENKSLNHVQESAMEGDASADLAGAEMMPETANGSEISFQKWANIRKRCYAPTDGYPIPPSPFISAVHVTVKSKV